MCSKRKNKKKGEGGDVVFCRPNSKVLSLVQVLSVLLTSTWRAGTRLSTGKSGKPRSDDSWEQSVMAKDNSWETLAGELTGELQTFR